MMDVSCLKTIASPGKSHWKDVPIDSSRYFLAIASFLDSSELMLWKEGDENQPKVLNGHMSMVRALCFGHNSEHLLLASASKQAINVWTIYDPENVDGMQGSCVNIGRDLGDVTHLSFSMDDSLISACICDEVWVINVKRSELVVTFIGHKGCVVASEFCSQNEDLLITISEDKTYGIWDLKEKEQVYLSSIISASSMLFSLASHPLENFFATGSSDGMLRVFDVTLHNSLHEVNIASKASNDEDNEDAGYSILSLKYWNRSKPIVEDRSFVKVALNEELYLAVGCSSCFMLLNANSLDILWVIYFKDVPLKSPSTKLSVASRIAFSISEEENLICTVSNVFTNDIHVLRVENTDGFLSSQLTVLSQDPLEQDSPLKSKLQPKSKQAPKKTKSNKPDKMNQPLTFKDKVKSAGYTKESPRKQMFTPRTNKNRQDKTSATNAVGPWGAKPSPRSTGKEYPIDSEPPTQLTYDKHHASALNDMSFSDSGRSLVCAMADGTASLLKYPKLESCVNFIGHNGSINSVCMNHSSNMLLSAGTDRTVKLWQPGQSDPVLDFTHVKHNFNKEKISQPTDSKNRPYSKDISCAKFYYVDQFIMLTHGSTLYLYKYHLDTAKNEIKRYQTSNRYKIVQEFEVSDARNITTFSTANSFYSYITLCACSNKSIVVFDINKAQPVRTISDAHARAVNSLCQNQGSSSVSQTSEAYDLFLTAAPTDGVKLWDLRQNKCVRKFEGHMNRAQKVGLAYSPCAKYVAVGSEDRSTYIYDIRSSSYLHRLSGHADVVTSVAFHPQKPLLACGTLSGQLRTYEVE